MASTAPGSISRLKCRVQRLFWAGKGTNPRSAIIFTHKKNKARPRWRWTKVRRRTELNLSQNHAHDASFSFIRGLTSRRTSAARFSRNHPN
jgi:hypothetical protein